MILGNTRKKKFNFNKWNKINKIQNIGFAFGVFGLFKVELTELHVSGHQRNIVTS